MARRYGCGPCVVVTCFSAARVVPCRKVVGLHKARGAIGRWRGVCRVYARLVQHSHLRVQQAMKVAISKGPIPAQPEPGTTTTR